LFSPVLLLFLESAPSVRFGDEKKQACSAAPTKSVLDPLFPRHLQVIGFGFFPFFKQVEIHWWTQLKPRPNACASRLEKTNRPSFSSFLFRLPPWALRLVVPPSLLILFFALLQPPTLHEKVSEFFLSALFFPYPLC